MYDGITRDVKSLRITNLMSCDKRPEPKEKLFMELMPLPMINIKLFTSPFNNIKSNDTLSSFMLKGIPPVLIRD